MDELKNAIQNNRLSEEQKAEVIAKLGLDKSNVGLDTGSSL